MVLFETNSPTRATTCEYNTNMHARTYATVYTHIHIIKVAIWSKCIVNGCLIRGDIYTKVRTNVVLYLHTFIFIFLMLVVYTCKMNVCIYLVLPYVAARIFVQSQSTTYHTQAHVYVHIGVHIELAYRFRSELTSMMQHITHYVHVHLSLHIIAFDCIPLTS